MRFQSHSLFKEYNLILNIRQLLLWLFISFSKALFKSWQITIVIRLSFYNV